MSDSDAPARLVISVTGRPAPQGSKEHGSAGQMREASPYLPAWRAAVKRAAYEAFRGLDIVPGSLPLFVGPVALDVTFRLDPERRVDSPPDIDKLLRSTCDALTGARVWEDDGRVVMVIAHKVPATDGEPTGAEIEVWAVPS